MCTIQSHQIIHCEKFTQHAKSSSLQPRFLNIEALKQSASTNLNKKCISATELREGGFHIAYLFKLEGETEDIGRVAYPDYPKLKTECEVAVMRYVKERTQIIVISLMMCIHSC